jgi:hypothetical protein
VTGWDSNQAKNEQNNFPGGAAGMGGNLMSNDEEDKLDDSIEEDIVTNS